MESANLEEWKDATAADNVDKMVMHPNFMGHMIKEIAVFYAKKQKTVLYRQGQVHFPLRGHVSLQIHGPPHEKLLCHQPSHPGNRTPNTLGDGATKQMEKSGLTMLQPF